MKISRHASWSTSSMQVVSAPQRSPWLRSPVWPLLRLVELVWLLVVVALLRLLACTPFSRLYVKACLGALKAAFKL